VKHGVASVGDIGPGGGQEKTMDQAGDAEREGGGKSLEGWPCRPSGTLARMPGSELFLRNP
jgi:hypothetical protein